jgi:hypothetical protein
LIGIAGLAVLLNSSPNRGRCYPEQCASGIHSKANAVEGAPTDLANRRDEDAATPAVALLDLPRISCDFAAGNNTGLRQEALLTVGGGAKWMGGPLIYDFYRTSPGTARLTAR